VKTKNKAEKEVMIVDDVVSGSTTQPPDTYSQ